MTAPRRSPRSPSQIDVQLHEVLVVVVIIAGALAAALANIHHGRGAVARRRRLRRGADVSDRSARRTWR